MGSNMHYCKWQGNVVPDGWGQTSERANWTANRNPLISLNMKSPSIESSFVSRQQEGLGKKKIHTWTDNDSIQITWHFRSRESIFRYI